MALSQWVQANVFISRLSAITLSPATPETTQSIEQLS
jgi:hypothetical protein